MDWAKQHWELIAALGGATLAWLKRQRIGDVWRWLATQGRTRRRIAELELDVAAWTARALQAEATRDATMEALRDLVEATSVLRERVEAGTMTIATSSVLPANSPPGSAPPNAASRSDPSTRSGGGHEDRD